MKKFVEELGDAALSAPGFRVEGRVSAWQGLSLTATVPGARTGDLVRIRPAAGGEIEAEVIGFSGAEVRLMPLGRAEGVGSGDRVLSDGRRFTVPCGDGLLGRVLDGYGRPMDSEPLPPGLEWQCVDGAPPNPLERRRVDRTLAMGVRSIDGLLTVGEGQRLGLFAGSGVGKSTLLGMIARQARADRIVIALVGERGREVREFLEDNLGREGRARSVVVCATSDAPAVARLRCGFVATAIAEGFRERGLGVLLLLDSITRLARAQREVGLAAGEPPGRRGFPPSVFAVLPALLERAGNSARGTLTAVYTVLVEGSDMDEPVADEVRSILDGHIVLDRAAAQRGRYPAVDPLASVSRLMDRVAGAEHREAAAWFRKNLALYEEHRDLITVGAYRKGSDPMLDRAVAIAPDLEAYLAQERDERPGLQDSVDALVRLWRENRTEGGSR
ncbi:MAG: FliI/YscN family ATPase [Deltaproteobacteria bacterium]|nr:FliI/YscN family ATPase [Deltaproteobacteria bacterium]